MEPSMSFVDLRKEAGESVASISSLNVNCMSQDRQQSSIIQGFSIRSVLDYKEDTPGIHNNDVKHIKALEKGHKAAIRAAELLNVKGRPATSEEMVRKPMMIVADTALVGGPPCEGHARAIEGITSFQEINIQFTTGAIPPSISSSLISSQYLHFSGTGPSPGCRMLNENGDMTFDQVTILSGMCLFSAPIIRSTLEHNGDVKPERFHYARPTFYEVEYICRAAPVIADFAMMVHSNIRLAAQRCQQSPGTTLSIVLDVPTFHYYQSIDGRLRDSTCTFDKALQWLDAVKHRHSQIATVFQNYVRFELLRRGLTTSSCDVKFTTSGDSVLSYIRRSLESSTVPSAEHLLQRLLTEDPVFLSYYKLLSSKDRPRDFKSIGYSFYVYEVIRPALAGNCAVVPESSPAPVAQAAQLSGNLDKLGRLLIGIDDGVERQIYSRAQKLLKKMRSSTDYPNPSTLMEVYMSRRVFINSNSEGSNLYLDDPSPENPVISSDEFANNQGRTICKEVEVHPFGMAAQLYGTDVARIVENMFFDVGLEAR